MSRARHRTTLQERRRVQRFGLASIVSAAAAIATAKTSAYGAVVVPALIVTLWTAVVTLKIAHRGAPAWTLGARLLFVPVVWFAIFQWALRDFTVIGFGSGDSSASIAVILLGAPWSLAIVGVWACALRRIFELESVHDRLPRKFCWALAPRLLLPSLLLVVTILVSLAQWGVGGGAQWSLVTGLGTLFGGVAVARAIPERVHSSLGQVTYFAGHLGASAAAAPTFGLLTAAFGVTGPDSVTEDSVWVPLLLGFSLGFCLLGMRPWLSDAHDARPSLPVR